MTDVDAGRRESVPPAEAWTAALIVAASVALRVLYAERLSFDTDEPQHLHVTWLWSQGLVAYRDFFDNHTPLFHVLAAPLVAAGGAEPELLVWIRHAMLPIVAVLLYVLYRLGRSLFSARAAVWAVAVVSVLPSFLYDSVEFRADVLWAALWITSLATWAKPPLTTARAFSLGLLLGVTLAASIKTLILVATFAAARGIVSFLEGRRWTPADARAIAAGSAGFALVTAAILIVFHQIGILPQAFDCLIAHNFSSVVLWRDRLPRVAMFVVTLPLLVLTARAVLRRSPSSESPRATFLLATGLYYTTLNGFVPIVPTQNLLPFYPMAALVTVALALGALDERPSWRPRGAALLAAVAIAEVALLFWASPVSQDKTRFRVGFVADVLRLTEPEGTVMDLKGESIFRHRPVYAVLEHITEERMKRGEIVDDIPERMIAARTFVSVVDSPRFPPKTRQFLLDNYVLVGRLRVAGRLLAIGGDGIARFEIAVPGRYAIVSPATAPMAGVLDGRDVRGATSLESGPHWFRPEDSKAPLAVVWAVAVERGYSPFRLGDP